MMRNQFITKMISIDVEPVDIILFLAPINVSNIVI